MDYNDLKRAVWKQLERYKLSFKRIKFRKKYKEELRFAILESYWQGDKEYTIIGKEIGDHFYNFEEDKYQVIEIVRKILKEEKIKYSSLGTAMHIGIKIKFM